MGSKKKIIITILIISSFFLSGLIFYLYKSRLFMDKSNVPEKGRWRPTRTGVLSEKEKAYQKVLTLGYLKGYNPASNKKNVTVFKEGSAWNGLNFCVSAHAPEAFLMSMDGKILHTWRYHPGTEIWPDAPTKEPESTFWRRAFLYQNGDVLAIYGNCGMIKIDRNSNLIWDYNSAKKPHHDIEVTDDGHIYLLTREQKIISSIDPNKPIREDFITILDSGGKVLKHVSLLKLVEKSKYRRLLEARLNDPDLFRLSHGDIFHTNTLEVFNGRLARNSTIFKKGNVLISLFTVDTIAIVDMDSEEMIWAMGNGMWKRQHQPTLLENGNMLIFDNWYTEDISRIIEFHPFTQEIVWEYKGDKGSQFYSKFCGSNQRLFNGNTLITETDNGRAFEVTKEGQIVWEFVNPHRAGKNNELIASLLEVIRIDPNYCSFLK